jgi:hypothetical protein
MAITAKVNSIEYKGFTPYDVNNCASYVGLSNNLNAFKIEQEDRRFTAQQCNNSIANNKEYFDDLYNELESGQVDRLFFNFLMARDISNYKFSNNRPNTKLYNDMKEANLSLLIKFLIEFVSEHHEKEYKIKSSEFFTMFNHYIVAGQFDFKMNVTRFGLELKDLLEFGITKKALKDGNYYIINVDVLKQHFINKKLLIEEFCD